MYVLIFIYMMCMCIIHTDTWKHTFPTLHTHTQFLFLQEKTSDSEVTQGNHYWNISCCRIFLWIVEHPLSLVSAYQMPIASPSCWDNQKKYPHKFPKPLFRKCITPTENSCSERWHRTQIRSIGVLPQGFSNWYCPGCEINHGNCQWACAWVKGSNWSAIREIKTDE